MPLTVLPFNGNQEVLTALLGGNTTAGFVNESQDMLPSIESARRERRGSNSQIRIPGTFVAIDSNGPRYSSGASGFSPDAAAATAFRSARRTSGSGPLRWPPRTLALST